MAVKHSTPADGTFSASGAAAWDASHTIEAGSISTTELGGDITPAGKALLDDADAAAQRTTLGLGTLATQSGTFSGTHSGDSSGTNTGDQVNIPGNAATVTTNANLTGPVTSVGNATAIAASVVTEAMQVLADNTTQDVSVTKHGYAPKAPNDASKFLDGTGAWTSPAGSGGLTQAQVLARVSMRM